MKRGANEHGRGVRGVTLLAYFFILLPAALLTLLALLNRVDAAQRQNQALEARVRARVLAESALAVAQTRGNAGPAKMPQGGELAGMGTWEIEVTTRGAVVAKGTARLGADAFTHKLRLMPDGRVIRAGHAVK